MCVSICVEEYTARGWEYVDFTKTHKNPELSGVKLDCVVGVLADYAMGALLCDDSILVAWFQFQVYLLCLN